MDDASVAWLVRCVATKKAAIALPPRTEIGGPPQETPMSTYTKMDRRMNCSLTHLSTTTLLTLADG